MGKFDYGIATRGIEKASETLGKSQDKRTEFLSDQLAKEMDWFMKAKEKAKEQAPLLTMFAEQQKGSNLMEDRPDTTGGMPNNPYSGFQGSQASQYPGGQSGMAGGQQVKDPFDVSTTPQPKVKYGKGGELETYSPSVKEQIYDRIAEKEKRNFRLTKKEKDFKDDYLGVNKKSGVWKESGLTDYKRNIILGKLQKGFYRDGVDDNGEPALWDWDRETAIAMILDSGYVNYEDDEEIMDILNAMGEEEDFSNLEFEPQPNVDYSDIGKGLLQKAKEGLGKTPDDNFSGYVDQARAGHQKKPLEETNQEGKVIVEDKDGKRYYLPLEQLEEALKQGYKQVD